MTRATTTWLAALLTALVIGATGCGGAAATAEDAGPDPQRDGGADAGSDASPLVALRIFHTSDEHGWLQPAVANGAVVGGAANVRAWWTAREGFDPARDLLLSGGDSWTGPAISTWFEGEPVVEAMNAMGYAATAVGNHEFDFGQDGLRARRNQAEYPMLAANVRVTATGEPADFALPYTITTVAGVPVGIIGLTTPSTTTAGNPALVEGLTFDSPYETLVAVVPEVRAAGAEVVVVLAHESFAPMELLARTLPVPVDAIFGGHDHSLQAEVSDGVPVITSGTAWRSYSVLTLTYDRVARAVVDAQYRQEEVAYPDGSPNPVTPDPAVAAIVAEWQGRADEALAEVLGYTATGLSMGTWAQANWVTDAWLAAYPEADLAIMNAGAIRQSLPPGEVTLGSLVSMLPFENYLYGVHLTGAQVVAEVGRAALFCGAWGGCWPLTSGMSWLLADGQTQVTLADGTAIDPLATYLVLILDYMYNGGGGYTFAARDPAPVVYSANYRDPVVAWTRQLGTGSADPLEAHLDSTPRGVVQ